MMLSYILLGLGLAPAVQERPAPIGVRIAVTHMAPDRWRVDYTFARPVTGLVYDQPVAGYRAAAWRPATPGFRLDTLDGTEAIVAEGRGGTRLTIDVARFGKFDHGRYVPQITFTDGGTALFLRYLAGRPIVDGETVDADIEFTYVALAGERVLKPVAETLDAYVYFGAAEPVASKYARFVVDSGAPGWVREALARVIEGTDRVYAEGLGLGGTAAPLVLIGAAGLDASAGASIKGDAMPGQFAMQMQGRGLREESPKKREMLERLVAHELAHVWQYRSVPQGFNPAEPWLHEGAAEAMAVEALGMAGIWGTAQVRAYATAADDRCRTATEGTTLAEAARAGSAEAIYACGFGIWQRAGGAGPLAAWARFAEAITREHRAFTQATLAALLPAGPAAAHTHDAGPGVPGHARIAIPAGAPYTAADVAFMQGMIAHHAQAIHMSRMAAGHGADPRLLKLANKIDQSQVAEIRIMQEWLTRNGQAVPDTSSWRTMRMAGMLTMGELAALDSATGRAFDRAYLTLMIRHHEGALQMVDALLAAPGAAQQVDVNVFANDVVAVQTAEIDAMRRMLSRLPDS